MNELAHCSDETLLSSVQELLGSHRRLTARLVEHLAEIEERRLHLVLGFSSMFDFCQRKLGMSEGESFRRILAARLGRRFPVVISLLATGRVNLTTLELVREELTQENHAELLEAVAGKSKRDVQSLLAVRFPRRDRPSTMRRSFVEPLSEARFRVEFTASSELVRKLELCRDLMSHANPSRDLEIVVERAVDLLLAELERTRLAKTKRPAGARGGSTVTPRRTPRAVHREVHERDGLQCTYVADDGRRCEARAFLELDHALPKALGGSNDADNLRVLCRAHNQLAAERAFGRAHVERSRNLRQQKSTEKRQRATTVERGVACESAARELDLFEKVRKALRALGFRDDEARRAIAGVTARNAAHPVLEVEQMLREALLVATAA